MLKITYKNVKSVLILIWFIDKISNRNAYNKIAIII